MLSWRRQKTAACSTSPPTGTRRTSSAWRGLGPVIQCDNLQYRAELRLMATADIGLRLAGMSADGTRFRMRNTFTRDDGEMTAR